jgi:hypothetical protein
VTRQSRWIDGGLIVAAALGALAVQPIGTMFHRPFWVDEAWVADLVKIPLSRQIALSSSTPIGWALLLRLVPGTAPERLRVVPLAFSAVAVVCAYLLARGLNWRTVGEARAAGVVAAAAVLLAPVSLQQNDLKQYSADGAAALLVLIVARDTERRHERTALVRLALVSVVAALFSTVSMFVAVAAFCGALGSAAITREWRRVRDVLVAGCGAGIVIALYAAVVVLPHDNDGLRNYWRPFYLDGSPGHILSTAGHRFLALGSSFGGSPKIVFVLFLAGLVVLVVRRNVALGIATAVLWVEMLTLGVADRYPFLDTRTSYFLLVVTLAIAAIGFAGLVIAIVRGQRALLVTLVAVAVVGLGFGARDHVRAFVYPNENPRVQTLYVAAHGGAGDVVVVNLLANWGFTYYWPRAGTRVFTAHDTIAAGYLARVDGINGVFATGRTQVDVLASMKTAVADWRADGGRGRIWIVRTHVLGAEAAAWTRAFARLHLHPKAVTGGPEPLLEVDPATS